MPASTKNCNSRTDPVLQLTEQQIEILTDRLDDALAEGVIPDSDTYNRILRAILPEEFAEPDKLPAKPTSTGLGSPQRANVYEQRAHRGEQLRHPRDSREFADERFDMLARALAGGCVAMVAA